MIPLVYWQDEQSGQLAPVVLKFLDTREELTETERHIFAAYLKIWVDHEWFGGGAKLAKLRRTWETQVLNGDRRSIEQWLEECLTIGIDPL